MLRKIIIAVVLVVAFVVVVAIANSVVQCIFHIIKYRYVSFTLTQLVVQQLCRKFVANSRSQCGHFRWSQLLRRLILFDLKRSREFRFG